MRVIVTLDVMLARRKKRAKELAVEIGITEANLSLLRTGKVKGVRFETLAKLCAALDCKPGDLLDIAPGVEAPMADEHEHEPDLPAHDRVRDRMLVENSLRTTEARPSRKRAL